MHKFSPESRPTRAHRHEAILEVVRAGEPRSQGALLRRLRLQGFRFAQSTLSRDLRDLGLVKGAAGYREAGDATPALARASRMEHMERTMRSHLTSVASAGNIVVLKTTPGMAHALGVALDRARLPEILGTVAGDDTLFAATPGPRRARALERQLHGLLGRR